MAGLQLTTITVDHKPATTLEVEATLAIVAAARPETPTLVVSIQGPDQAQALGQDQGRTLETQVTDTSTVTETMASRKVTVTAAVRDIHIGTDTHTRTTAITRAAASTKTRILFRLCKA